MPAPGELVFASPRRAKPPRHLADLDPSQRREVVAALGEKPFRAGQLSTHYFTRLADDLADHSYHLHTRTNSVQKEMERRELGAQVQAGIDKLSPDLRTCVILRDIEELSDQEIVDLLKIPEGTVKSRINRGRIELAKILRRMKVVAMSEA